MEYDKKIYCSGDFLESKKGQNGSFGFTKTNTWKIIIIIIIIIITEIIIIIMVCDRKNMWVYFLKIEKRKKKLPKT